MTYIRKSSLDPINIPDWRWKKFLDSAILNIQNLDIMPCNFSEEFLQKQALTGSKSNPQKVTTNTWACRTEKLEKVRAVCLQAGASTSVFNFVAIPSVNYEIPFFGADFVTLPSGHLIALDLQPVLSNDTQHINKFMKHLKPLSSKYLSIFPNGGEIPLEAKKFFSPGFIWTRLPLSQESDEMIHEHLMSAFIQYFDLYLNIVQEADLISHERSLLLRQGQHSYLQYRSSKDPARGMLTRFYGKEWTECYINDVIFSSIFS